MQIFSPLVTLLVLIGAPIFGASSNCGPDWDFVEPFCLCTKGQEDFLAFFKAFYIQLGLGYNALTNVVYQNGPTQFSQQWLGTRAATTPFQGARLTGTYAFADYFCGADPKVIKFLHDATEASKAGWEYAKAFTAVAANQAEFCADDCPVTSAEEQNAMREFLQDHSRFRCTLRELLFEHFPEGLLYAEPNGDPSIIALVETILDESVAYAELLPGGLNILEDCKV